MRFETHSGTCHSTSGPELLADILPRVVERIGRPVESTRRPLVVVEGSSQTQLFTPRTSCTPTRRASDGGRLRTIPMSPICK